MVRLRQLATLIALTLSGEAASAQSVAWFGLDLGIGTAFDEFRTDNLLDCCSTSRSPAIIGAVGAGARIHSRFGLAAEVTRSRGVAGKTSLSAWLAMLTGRVGTSSGLSGKAGVGRAGSSVGGSPSVDNHTAFVLGAEKCALGHVERCAVLDYSWAREPHRRMAITRLGFSLRSTSAR
jgi:hypothetical protein